MCKAFVTFKKLPRMVNRKTDTWRVDKINSNIKIAEQLGFIRFKGSWRQFVFEPLPYTDWNYSCLVEIVDFLKEQNEKWRNEIKKR